MAIGEDPSGRGRGRLYSNEAMPNVLGLGNYSSFNEMVQ